MAVTSAERTPCPMTSQINKPALLSEQRQHVEKIASHLPGGMIAMAELEQARFLRGAQRESRDIAAAAWPVGCRAPFSGPPPESRSFFRNSAWLRASSALTRCSRSSACLRTVMSRNTLRSSDRPSSISMKELDNSKSTVLPDAEGDVAFQLRVQIFLSAKCCW